jgi:hypothetical protein
MCVLFIVGLRTSSGRSCAELRLSEIIIAAAMSKSDKIKNAFLISFASNS